VQAPSTAVGRESKSAYGHPNHAERDPALSGTVAARAHRPATAASTTVVIHQAPSGSFLTSLATAMRSQNFRCLIAGRMIPLSASSVTPPGIRRTLEASSNSVRACRARPPRCSSSLAAHDISYTGRCPEPISGTCPEPTGHTESQRAVNSVVIPTLDAALGAPWLRGIAWTP
jgi:hypothetical protein